MTRFTTKLGAGLIMPAVAAALGLAALGQPRPAAAQDLPGGTWGLAQAVNLTALAPAGSQFSGGTIQDVSCTSPGNCAAIGGYTYLGNGGKSMNPFVLSETGGTWGTPAAVAGITGIAPATTGAGHVSCAAPGECAATWNSDHAYVIDESGGVWGQAQPVTIGTVSTSLTGVSCPAAGDCTAIGSYLDGALGTALPFVMDSSAGTWDAPQEVQGVAALSSPSPVNGALTSVSCTSAGNCLGGGSYHFTSTDGQTHTQPFLAIETDGSWGQAQNVAGMATLNPDESAALVSVSCGTSGDCAAAGIYQAGSAGSRKVWVADESSGSWSPAQKLPTPAAAGQTEARALSCSPQGFCAVTGFYYPVSGGGETAFTATYSGGTWAAQGVPGLAAGVSIGTTVSCSAPGYCTVAGGGFLAGGGQYQLFFADDVNGTWVNAQGVPSMFAALITGLSCTAPGYCTAAGQAGDITAFTLSEATASAVSLTASAPVVHYGNEGSETLTATVTSPAGGTPSGTVTVSSGSATICTPRWRAGPAGASWPPPSSRSAPPS